MVRKYSLCRSSGQDHFPIENPLRTPRTPPLKVRVFRIVMYGYPVRTTGYSGQFVQGPQTSFEADNLKFQFGISKTIGSHPILPGFKRGVREVRRVWEIYLSNLRALCVKIFQLFHFASIRVFRGPKSESALRLVTCHFQ